MIPHRWLGWMLGLSVSGILPTVLHGGAPRSSTTIYVGNHFEVRDREQTVKYVYNGETRVARITGTLSGNARVQRFRLRTGWNLIALGVTATNGADQLTRLAAAPTPLIKSLYQWLPATHDYAPVTAGLSLAAGTVLWLEANTNAVVTVTGSYRESAGKTVAPGGAYVSSGGLETWSPAVAGNATVWRFDSRERKWQADFGGELTSLKDALGAVPPGEAIFVQTGEWLDLPPVNRALGIRYYHGDHLGSATVVTDANGEVVEETAFYPFGAPRHEERPGATDSHYTFAQTERDGETGLHAIGHRYLNPVLGRWLSTDPLLDRGGGPNPYAYANQNPLKYYDPDGAEVTVTLHAKDGKDFQVPTHVIEMKAVLIDLNSKKFTQAELEAYAAKLKSTIEDNFKATDTKKNEKWITKLDLKVVTSEKDIGAKDHVFRIVDRTKHRSGGSAPVGGLTMDIAAHSLRAPLPEDVDHNNPANKHYTREFYQSPEGIGAHEFGHSIGLHHDDREPNLMNNGEVQRWDVKKITLEQLKRVEKLSKANFLNSRDPKPLPRDVP